MRDIYKIRPVLFVQLCVVLFNVVNNLKNCFESILYRRINILNKMYLS